MLSDSEREFCSAYVRLPDPKARVAEYIRLGLPGADKSKAYIRKKIAALVESDAGAAAVLFERTTLLASRRAAAKAVDTAEYQAARALADLRKTAVTRLKEAIELESGDCIKYPERERNALAKLIDVALHAPQDEGNGALGVKDPVRLEALARQALGIKRQKEKPPEGPPAAEPPPAPVPAPEAPDFRLMQGEDGRA